jgi:hypothetical protein
MLNADAVADVVADAVADADADAGAGADADAILRLALEAPSIILPCQPCCVAAAHVYRGEALVDAARLFATRSIRGS